MVTAPADGGIRDNAGAVGVRDGGGPGLMGQGQLGIDVRPILPKVGE